MEFGFDKPLLQKIYTNVFSFKTALAKILEKNGYYSEAIHKNAVIKNGMIYDDYTYVKLK